MRAHENTRSFAPAAGFAAGLAALGAWIRERIAPDTASAPPSGENARALSYETAPCFMFQSRVTVERRSSREGRTCTVVGEDRAPGSPSRWTRVRSKFGVREGRLLEHTVLAADRGFVYRFTPDGYSVTRLGPSRGAADPAGAAPGVPESLNVFSAPRDADGIACRLTTLSALLHDDAVDLLERAVDDREIWIATPRGPRRMHVEVEERRSGLRALRDASGRPRATTVDECRVTLTPADPQPVVEGVLDARCGISMWIDLQTATVFEIETAVPGRTGRVDLTLQRIG